MSHTATGYIEDATADDGVAIIPAPPSEEMKDVDRIASVGSSSCPSHDSVSAAIALVRAKQVAKSAILRAEEQILRPRSASSDQTANSGATESSSVKDKLINVETIFEGENEVPAVSTKKENKSISSVEEIIDLTSESLPHEPSYEQTPGQDSSLPTEPSYEETPDQASTIVESPSDVIPAPPSFGSSESDGNDNTNTIDDVNAFLSRLGVEGLRSASNESIDRLREMASGGSDGSFDDRRLLALSSDGMISQGSAPLEVQPKTEAQISALIDFIREEHEFLNQRDPPSMRAVQTQKDNIELPGPSRSSETDKSNYKENPFIDHSFSGDSLEEDSPTTIGDEKKMDLPDKNSQTRLGDESFAADVRKTLSTVQEVLSIEAEDDDDDYEQSKDDVTSPQQGSDKLSQPRTLAVAASDEQESVYGADGRKEPKGVYEKAEVEVEEIPVTNIGVEHAIKNNLSLMSTDSHRIASERHVSIGQGEVQNKSKGSENNENNDSASISSQGFSDTGSLPWALRDVASEETLRATGRSRPHFVVSGARPSRRSRNVASLFDDTSVQESEAASEFRSGLSFGSDNRSEANDPDKDEEEPERDEEPKKDEEAGKDEETEKEKDEEPEKDEEAEIEASDSVEADNRCMVDTFLYNTYEPENDYAIQRGISSGISSGEENEKRFVDEKTIEIEDISRQQPGGLGDVKLENEQDETNAKTEKVEKEESNPFLRQFEALDLNDESGDEAEAQVGIEVEIDDDPILKFREADKDDTGDDMSPAELVTYLSTLDQRIIEGEDNELFINDFKALIMPLIDMGKIPTVIEEAQIRQAAVKASVRLDHVDTFIDYVKDRKLEVTLQPSKEQSSCEKDFTTSSDGVDGLDEDDAIAAFLSAKTEDSFKPSEDKTIASVEEEEEEKEGEEPTGDGNLDNELSASSVFDQEGQDKADPEKSEDNGVEKDFDMSRDPEGDFRKREEESVRDIKGSEMSANNDRDPVKVSGNEKDENSVDLLEAVRNGIDPVDATMLAACEKIQGYDEGIWQRRTAMATYGWEWEEATWLSPKSTPVTSNFPGHGIHSRDGIHSVTAGRDVTNFMFNKRSFPLARKFCKQSYKRRVKPHKGYFDVDIFSLQESAASGKENMFKDETPWEIREVRQRFLHERSLTFSRNWFGDLVKTSGNDKIKAPTCKPKSMEMPMRNIPDPGDWTPEWYTTWGGRKFLMRRPSFDSASVQSDADSGADTYTERDYDDKDDSLRSYSSAGSTFEDEDEWEDAPECGTFVNTKLKIGEHVTRVHPDYTSSLRKSRWRKKYFPIGTFPY